MGASAFATICCSMVHTMLVATYQPMFTTTFCLTAHNVHENANKTFAFFLNGGTPLTPLNGLLMALNGLLMVSKDYCGCASCAQGCA